MCNYLAVRCYLDANELNEALQILNLIDVDSFTCTGAPQISALENEMFDDTPKSVRKKNNYSLVLVGFFIVCLFVFLLASKSSFIVIER